MKCSDTLRLLLRMRRRLAIAQRQRGHVIKLFRHLDLPLFAGVGVWSKMPVSCALIKISLTEQWYR